MHLTVRTNNNECIYPKIIYNLTITPNQLTTIRPDRSVNVVSVAANNLLQTLCYTLLHSTVYIKNLFLHSYTNSTGLHILKLVKQRCVIPKRHSH